MPSATTISTTGFIKVALEHALQDHIAVYMWHASKRQKMVEEAWEKNGLLFHQQIIWAKPRALIARCFFLWRHEPCLFGWIQGNKAPRVCDEHPNTVWEIEGLSGDERPDHPTPTWSAITLANFGAAAIPAVLAENLVGFAAHPRGLVMAMRYLQPLRPESYLESGPVTDPQTRISIGYRRYYDNDSGKEIAAFECVYGFKPAIPDGIKRLVSA